MADVAISFSLAKKDLSIPHRGEKTKTKKGRTMQHKELNTLLSLFHFSRLVSSLDLSLLVVALVQNSPCSCSQIPDRFFSKYHNENGTS